jgi:hypothetical protein
VRKVVLSWESKPDYLKFSYNFWRNNIDSVTSDMLSFGILIIIQIICIFSNIDNCQLFIILIFLKGAKSYNLNSLFHCLTPT